MFLKKLMLVLLAMTAMAPVSSLAEEAKFFSGLTDIPLMPGLYEVAKDSVSFDKAEGRIVETAAASETLNPGQIKTFYAAALPQLGWIEAAKDTYVRDGERLTLRMESNGKLNIIHLSLSPTS